MTREELQTIVNTDYRFLIDFIEHLSNYDSVQLSTLINFAQAQAISRIETMNQMKRKIEINEIIKKGCE